MANTPGEKQVHVPQRTCVGCRKVEAQRTLTRLVRTPDGVRIDLEGTMPGRGAYLHDRRSCWKKGLKRGLGHALKTALTGDDLERLKAFMATLPPEERRAGGA